MFALTPRKLLLLSVAVIGLVAAAWWIRGQVLIDDCLDGGGRWDYGSESCEGGR